MVLWTDLVGIAAYVLSAVVVAIASFVRGYRDRMGSRGFVVMLFAVWLWLAAYGTALLAETWINPLWAYNLILLAASLGSVGVFAFVLAYTRQYALSAREFAALSIVPLVTQLAAWTNPYHGLIWDPATRVLAGGGVDRVHGLLFFVPHAVYSYGLAFAALALLGVHTVRAHGVYQKQSLVLLASGLLVPVADIVDITLSPISPGLDLTPLAFLQFTVVVMMILFRYRFLDLAPIARQQAVEAMNDGVLVLDETQRILDLNGPTREFLRATGPVVGESIVDYRPEVAAAIEQSAAGLQSDGGTVTVEDRGGSAVYDLNISQFSIGPEQFGHIVVVRDVTDRERRETELQRQNDRLDRFASVVSHDLRNPLSVIGGHFELIDDDVPAEHAEPIARNLDRMERMLDDLLTMARAGDPVTETETVGLAGVATDAWDHVDTAATQLDLAVPEAVTVEADRGRLLHVFENCFRNAVEHNDAPVTVRVGTLGGDETRCSGFYIEDDGRGIPEAEQDEILEDGYTTSEDGIGLGLSIVEDMVTAHGWTLAVTDGTDGGARFEISGIDPGA